MVLGGFRSFHVLVTRSNHDSGTHAIGYFESRCILASPYTMNRSKRFICFSLIIELSFLH